MTIYVTKGEHGEAVIGQQAHMSHWKLEIQSEQISYVINELQTILNDNITKDQANS